MHGDMPFAGQILVTAGQLGVGVAETDTDDQHMKTSHLGDLTSNKN